MTAFPSYATGTVSVNAGDTAIVGVGTIWSGVNVRAGDDIVIAGHTVIVQDVTDATHIAIDAWPYSNVAAGSAYKVVQRSPLRFAGGQAMADVSALVAALNTDGFYVFVGSTLSVPDPSYGNDGQYAFQPSTGKLWFKTSGVWTFLGIYKGFGTPAPYDNTHTYGLLEVATSSGSSYVYINATPSSGNAPPNATYWAVLASKGDTGATGPTGASYGGTSTTSLVIGTGSKAFTTQSGLAYQNGARVRATATSDTTKWMEGVATYSGTALTINVDKTNGSGTFASWNFNLVGQPGAGDLSSANNLSDLASAVASRQNLGVPLCLYGHINGLVMSTAGGSSTFSVVSGVAVDSSATDVLVNPGTLSKTGGAWAVGSGNGSWDGVGTSPLAGGNFGWYHVYLIKRPDTGVVDLLTSSSATSPTLPTNYTLFRRIGAMKVDGSGHWLAFTQVGEEFHWAANVAELAASAIGNTTANTITLGGVPPGVNVEALFHGAISPGASANGVLFSSLDENDIGVLGAAGSRNASLWAQTSGSFQAADFRKRTNTSAQIRWRAFAAQGDVSIYLLGWIDRRGRDI